MCVCVCVGVCRADIVGLIRKADAYLHEGAVQQSQSQRQRQRQCGCGERRFGLSYRARDRHTDTDTDQR